MSIGKTKSKIKKIMKKPSVCNQNLQFTIVHRLLFEFYWTQEKTDKFCLQQVISLLKICPQVAQTEGEGIKNVPKRKEEIPEDAGINDRTIVTIW